MAVLLPASVRLLLILFAVSGGCGHSHEEDEKESEAGGYSYGQDKDKPIADTSKTPITIRVINSLSPGPTQTYSTYVVYRGILLGGMRRLQETVENFTFTYSENSDYGPYLESVNGLPGSFVNHTYWELLVKKPNGTVIIPDVGIGCYIPTANDVIILNYTKYCKV